MPLPLKLVGDRRTWKDGINPMGIQYCYTGDKRTVADTEINIPIRCWNKKLCSISKEIPMAFRISEEINEKLDSQKRGDEDIVRFA